MSASITQLLFTSSNLTDKKVEILMAKMITMMNSEHQEGQKESLNLNSSNKPVRKNMQINVKTPL